MAWTIAATRDVFVTRDQGLLSHSDAIYAEYGVTLARPADVIGKFDELRNEHEYQRDRLIGTDVRQCRRSSDAADLATAFHLDNGEEKKAELARTLNRVFANPDDCSCIVVYGPDGNPLCCYVRHDSAPGECVISLLRIASAEHRTRTGSTIARAVLATIVKEAAERGRSIIRITDRKLPPVFKNAARDRQFASVNGDWIKLSLDEVIPDHLVTQRLNELIARIKGDVEDFRRFINGAITRSRTAEGVLELENLIWPGKISGTNVDSFIVPIRHNWAADLFDGRLTSERLWPADADLVLNVDSVYYRPTRPRVFGQKGRILWYVSDGYPAGSKMLRACSQLTGVEIGSPKELFRRFRRFGVYEWRHVIETAKSESGQVMSLEFTNTELFDKPIDWAALQTVLKRHGKENYTFPSPVKVDDELFFELYRHGSS